MVLFDTPPQTREEVSIWKLFHTTIMFFDLTGGIPVKWSAINIPMNYFENNGFNGDIDIIICLDDFNNARILYRCFEVKVSTMNKDGKIKSLKEGKINKTIAQLKKLEKFGSKITFLLEIFNFETGTSDNSQFLPSYIQNVINKKVTLIKKHKLSCGYSIKILEFLKGLDEGHYGKLFPYLEILPSKLDILTDSPLKNLVSKINDLFEKNKIMFPQKDFIPVLFYCKKCKNIAFAGILTRNPVCQHCGYIFNTE